MHDTEKNQRYFQEDIRNSPNHKIFLWILLKPKRSEEPHGRHAKRIKQIRCREFLARQPRTLHNAVLQQLQQLLRHGF